MPQPVLAVIDVHERCSTPWIAIGATGVVVTPTRTRLAESRKPLKERRI